VSTWVLLRGLAREARHWGDFPARFAEAVPDARVLTLDLPGNGRLSAAASPASVPRMVEAARQLLLQRGAMPPYHLLALSLGAMVAVDWASRHPQELAGCVLINTSLRPFSPLHHRLRPRAAATLLRLLLAGPDDRRRERGVLRLTSRLRRDDAALLDNWVAWGREHPVLPVNALRQLFAAARYRAPAVCPPVPLQVLASAGDQLVDPRCSLELARRWSLPVALHPCAGHDLPLDDGAWVAAQVRGWLQAAASSSASSASNKASI
jgi:pimeloyl-ACP methyl ester carboxylesterase